MIEQSGYKKYRCWSQTNAQPNETKNVTAVFLALDADEEIKNKIRAHCENTNVEIRDAKKHAIIRQSVCNQPSGCLRCYIKKEKRR